MIEKTTIELISQITEFNDIKEFMQDEDLDEALALIIKLIAKPHVNAMQVPDLINKMQSLAAKFAVMSRFYTTFEKGGDSSKKKNVYYTAEDAINKIVDALKYSARYGV